MTSQVIKPRLTVLPGSKEPGERRPEISDDQLLAGIRGGKAEMAEPFYWRVKPVVDRTVQRLWGRIDPDGEDIVQLTLIQLIEALPRYRGECPLDAWVSAVSANVVYKHIRRRRLERSVFVGLISDGPPATSDDNRPAPATASVQARELSARVGAHLSELEPARAWAFMLHDVCGYSLAEIAHICGISSVAAQSRLSRGRRDLHERIRRDPELADLLEREGGRG
jgi:RNA polymerase sigma-70 factor (ECF subfamily)